MKFFLIIFFSKEDLKPTQVIHLTKKGEEHLVDLEFVLFQDVHCLTIFVESNYSAETTKIVDLKLIGEGLLTVKNLDNLKDEHDHN